MDTDFLKTNLTQGSVGRGRVTAAPTRQGDCLDWPFIEVVIGFELYPL